MNEASGPQSPLSLIGETLLSRYVLKARIASGGMSVVFRAEDERLHRPVCVKVFLGINPDGPDYRTHYEHFVQEAFALSQLTHPNTLRVYDFGYLEAPPKAPFYVSELLEGGTFLQRVRREGPQTPQRMLQILGPLVQALEEAHARGIIHRDIKPSNILFGAPLNDAGSPVPKLADFGIAKAGGVGVPHRAGDTRVTGARISLYSPGWAAPEQMRAEPVGPQTDVFSLGLLLAFGVSGRKVFPERAQHVAYSVRDGGEDVIIDALELLDLPKPILRVCLRACRTQASERFATPSAFLDALRDGLNEPPTNPAGSIPPGRAMTGSATPAVSEPPRESVREPARPTAEPTQVEGPRRDSQSTRMGSGSSTPEPRMLFRLERLIPGEVVAAGRKIRLVSTDGAFDLGGDDAVPGRVRLTFVEGGEKGRLHLRGLNCFVIKDGARASSAVELSRSTRVSLLGADRRSMGSIDVVLGRMNPEGQVRFRLFDGELALPPSTVQHAALFHFDAPETSSWLVYSPMPALAGG